jgi:hypothetical protein
VSAGGDVTVLHGGGIVVTVRCPTRADVAWLEEFLAPTFQAARPCETDYTVDASIDPDRYRSLLATQPPGPLSQPVTFVFDQGVFRTRGWLDARSGQRLLADAAHGVVYVLSEEAARVEVVGEAGGRLFRGAVMRVVRERAMARAWTPAGFVLHAGAMATNGCAIVFGGPKRGGKTSLLLHALHVPGAEYIANDRVVLSMENDAPVARGMPTIVSLRHDTLALFPVLARRLAQRGLRADLSLAEVAARPPDATAADGDGAGISPVQVCDLLGVPMRAGAPLGAVVLPRVDPGERRLRLRRMEADEAAEAFEAVLFAAASPVRISEVFGPPAPGPAFDPEQARALWSRVVRAVPTFECRIGREAFAAGAGADPLASVLSELEAAGGAPS